MIRKFENKDLEEIMKIWLNVNIQAHDFIPEDYWKDNFDSVKSMLPDAEIYVYESEGKIKAFAGIDNGYIAGIFVSNEMQSNGVGKQLLDKTKELYPNLSLTVYKKNRKAINFYKRERFIIKQEQIDENTGEVEYLMAWRQVDINTWMNQYLSGLKNLFGFRLEFVGLQGSYGRGEATDGSDIDVVVILNHADPEDLKAYSTMLDSLLYREKVCGFISGIRELKHWESSDLFQFYYDTTPVFGSIDFLKELIGTEDIRRAIRIGACNIYHMCGHNMVHERDGALIKELYKSAAFTVQAVSYLQTETYRKRKTELLPVLQQPEREILETAIALKQQTDLDQAEFDRFSGQLFRWASDLIAEYKVT